MKEPDSRQKSYLDNAARAAKPRRCRCGGTAEPIGASSLMSKVGANAFSTSIHYRCPACGYQFQIGLVGDAIGFLIVAAILGRIGFESLWGGVIFVPIALLLTIMAINKIRLRLRHSVVKPPSA
jgi:hypothetical protein